MSWAHKKLLLFHDASTVKLHIPQTFLPHATLNRAVLHITNHQLTYAQSGCHPILSSG